jgi:DNA-binding CsgD family transcriptional regulator
MKTAPAIDTLLTPAALPDPVVHTSEFPEIAHQRVPDDATAGTGDTWSAVRRVRMAIRELREISSLRLLVDATPAAVCRLGFDRAMVSRIEDSTWVVERFYSEKESAWADEINEIAQRTPQQLSPALFEADIVRRRMPLLVAQAQHEARVSPALAQATKSESYVAAPIMPDGRVIGFLHADRYFQGRPVSRFDLELLSQFADQFGQILERTLLLERLDSLRSSVATLTDVLNGTVTDCRSAEIDMSVSAPSSPANVAQPLSAASTAVRSVHPTPDSVLTSREVEVLRLMAAGDTNGRIATRLVISEGTVKSHVKHILRKLNAANRAEAVCRWLQAPHPA